MSVEKATDSRVEAGAPATMGSELTSHTVAFSGFAAHEQTFSRQRFMRQRENQGHLPALTIDQFIEQSPRVARMIDLDKDGAVSRREVSIAVDNPFITGHDAQVVGALYKLNQGAGRVNPYNPYDPLVNMRIDSMRDELKTLAIIADGKVGLGRKAVPLQFNSIDTNDDGIINAAELRKAYDSNPSSAPELTFATKLFYSRELEALKADQAFSGLTRSDLRALNAVMDDTAMDAVKVMSEAIKRVADAQNDLKSTSLYANADNPLESIKPSAINQGYVGNCYFESVVAGFAERRPELIRDMIEETGNGVYIVTFAGEPDNPIYVTMPSDANLGLFNKGTEHGLWANVLENAFGQYRAQIFETLDKEEARALGANPAGSPEDALWLMSGNATFSIWPKDYRAPIQELIDGLNIRWQRGSVMTLSTSTNVPDEPYAKGILTLHGYSLLNIYEKDGVTRFVIRDPYGERSTKDGAANGVFEMTAAEAFQVFNSINIEDK